MIGNHAIPIITEAYLKAFGISMLKKAYEAMKETSLSQGNGLGLFRTYNYIPCDLEKNLFPRLSNMPTMTGVWHKWQKP